MYVLKSYLSWSSNLPQSFFLQQRYCVSFLEPCQRQCYCRTSQSRNPKKKIIYQLFKKIEKWLHCYFKRRDLNSRPLSHEFLGILDKYVWYSDHYQKKWSNMSFVQTMNKCHHIVIPYRVPFHRTLWNFNKIEYLNLFSD